MDWLVNVPGSCAQSNHPTMPIPQWRICLQWNQIGAASFVMLMENWVPAVNPESKPPGLLSLAAKYVQGAAKDDCVTE